MFRKLLITGIAMLVLSGAALANGDSKWSYGVKLGVNMANMTLDPSPSGLDMKMRTGLGIGGIVNYNLNEKMNVRTDVLYLSKGAKMEATGFSGENKISVLAINPMYTYQFATWACKLAHGKQAGAFAEVGPELALKLSAKDQDDKTLDYSGTEVALNLGVGINIPVGAKMLSPELRYSMGLTNVSTKSGQTAKTSGIQIMFGYMF